MKKLVASAVIAGTVTIAMAGVNAGACKGCHGQKWEKHALGTSKVVANMTHADIEKALIGYKKGTYGGAKKGIMKGQVARYSEADLKAFSQTVGK
jgi:cytochrome c-type protein NapB